MFINPSHQYPPLPEHSLFSKMQNPKLPTKFSINVLALLIGTMFLIDQYWLIKINRIIFIFFFTTPHFLPIITLAMQPPFPSHHIPPLAPFHSPSAGPQLSPRSVCALRPHLFPPTSLSDNRLTCRLVQRYVSLPWQRLGFSRGPLTLFDASLGNQMNAANISTGIYKEVSSFTSKSFLTNCCCIICRMTVG